MIDVKILTIKDLLTISGARYAPGVVPRSLIIDGQNFDEATEVIINDQAAPEFIIVNASQIMAQVPNGEVNKVLSKVAVLAEKPSPNRKSLLSFSFGSTFRALEGFERMVQIFVKLLLQTPGSDRFAKNLGGGLLTIIGQTYSGDSAKAIQSAAVTAVNRTRDQLAAIQAKNSRIPNDEKILTANIEAVGFNDTTTTLLMRILLTAVSGRQAVANLSF
jgi:phage baseplate assembly protein W